MDNNCDKEKMKSDLMIRVKAKRTPRLKSSSDQTDKMTLVEVEVSEEFTESTETLELSIHFQSGVKTE
ncbi:MAG: hypothetical protein IPM74_03775 [Crocinitomicaceae bacterium]|nr:hypothetical protein [Crocinitomicaceae bacterium]MBK8925033.1 hypothetical protein [Crocinitomicaceae bacterium]